MCVKEYAFKVLLVGDLQRAKQCYSNVVEEKDCPDRSVGHFEYAMMLVKLADWNAARSQLNGRPYAIQ